MKTAAVVVTFNRLEKLKICLNAFDNQKKHPDYLIVVDNASTDGTHEWLMSWLYERTKGCKKILLTGKKNRGGSGGFYIGLKKALTLDADWIYAADDDAYPDENAFAEFYAFCSSHPCDDYAAIAAAVTDHGGYSLGHRRIMTKGLFQIRESVVKPEAYKQDYFEFNIYSFVGVFLNSKKLEKAGLPQRDYFIQWDDTEHSIRMSKQGKMVCVPAIRVEHAFEFSPHAGFQWKDYYGTRNRMDAVRRNFPKRYFIFMSLKRIVDLIHVRLFEDKDFAGLFTAAVFDAWSGRLGLHKTYRPGWLPDKDKNTLL